MQQFRDLRRALQAIVLASLPAACVGTVDSGVGTVGGRCGQTVSKSFSFATPSDPAVDLRVESCRVDADACKDLCTILMQRAGLSTPSTCAVQFRGDTVEASASYWQEISGPGCAAEGRRPAGLVTPRGIEATTRAGAWLAQAAWLEAASIPAFVYLARELDAFGAPRGLARAALAAVRDEIRHARIMNTLAARFGGRPPVADVALPAPRTIEDLAIENAIEGCVRETWGAIVAMWQAERAQDRELREAFREISVDEARHAALAWAVDRWAGMHLDAAARRRVADARLHAVHELLEGDDTAIPLLGLPVGTDAHTLVARTREALWNGGLS